MRCFHPSTCFGHWKKKKKQATKHAQAVAESIKQDFDLISQSQAKDHLVEVNKADAASGKPKNNGVLMEIENDDNEKGKGKEGEENHAPDELLLKQNCTNNSGDDSNPQEGDIWCCSPCPVEAESSESLFSLSIDSRKHHLVSAVELGDDKEVSSALKKMTPNHTQREIVITGRCPLVLFTADDKENFNLGAKCNAQFNIEAAEVKQSDTGLNERDTSLSSWLVGSGKTTPCKNESKESSPGSEKSHRNNQILRECTPADLKPSNGHSSAGSTPCHSADDKPRLGTVGRFWQRTGLASQ